MKECKHCKEEFPNTSEYFAIRKKNKDGFSGVCKSCIKIKQKDYEENNRDNIKEYYRNRTNKIRKEKGLPPLRKKLVAREGYKICTNCEKELLATTGYFHNAKNNKSGLNAQCKDCRTEYNRIRAKEEREKNKNYEIREINKESKKDESRLKQQKNEELREKRKNGVFKRPIITGATEGLKLNDIKVQLGQVYKIATPKKKGEPQGFFIGTLIQETKVHITLRNKAGRCESFLKADLLLKEYEIKEAI